MVTKKELNALTQIFRRGEFEKVIKIGSELALKNPRSSELFNIVGAAALKSNRYELAQSLFEKALSLNKSSALIHMNLGFALSLQQKSNAALKSFTKSDRLDPTNAYVKYNIGKLQLKMGKTLQAIRSFQNSIKIDSKQSDAHSGLGTALQIKGESEQATLSLVRAIELNPRDLIAKQNLAIISMERGELVKAEKLFRDALHINSNYVPAVAGMGAVFLELRRFDEAQVCFRRALTLDRNYVEAHYHLGVALSKVKKETEALAHLNEAIRLDQNHILAIRTRISTILKLAAWSDLEDELKKAPGSKKFDGWMTLLGSMYLCDSQLVQLRRAKNLFSENVNGKTKPLPFGLRKSSRIKIGYISRNLYDHPVLDLTKGLLQNHNRDEFEVHVIGYNPNSEDFLPKPLLHQIDEFHDLTNFSNQDFVQYIRDLDLDIAIDMSGHTTQSRSRLFAHGLGRVQINYLAFPGTMGSEAYDYIVADKVVIPEDQTGHYVEKVIWMPGSFMPSDNKREIDLKPTRRSDYSLPDDGFVFCAFNNAMKISPREFDIWMRLISRIEGSCLWLSGGHEQFMANIRKEAQARGVDPDRIVFTERVPKAEHLARHRHADLFLDTFNYNAHTTANEALWAGLPLVTKLGQQFSARVASSLLTAVGLPELITETEAEYEALAYELAMNPEKLAKIRQRLNEDLTSTPLFDTEGYVSAFEQGLKQAYQNHLNENKTDHITVEETAQSTN